MTTCAHLLTKPALNSPSPPQINSPNQNYFRPWFVLVCLHDISPPLLVHHILHLVGALNSNRGAHGPGQYCKLVPLPKGSEIELARTLEVRRAAVILFRVRCR